MPLDTVLCVDTSGSMAGRGMRELKEACRTFVDGVRETAYQTGAKENVAIVEFGKQVHLVSRLTNDYDVLQRAVDTLSAGGRTPMREGLLKAMEEIIERGGVVTIRNGQRLSPRIILMTDGVPTDDNGETAEARQAVLDQAHVFGTRWKDCGLPNCIPIACVGCGDCEPELLESIATATKGMFVIVDDITKLGTFFRRQVLLTRFALQSANAEAIQSQEALHAFLADLGEAVDGAELDGLFRLLLGMIVLEKIAGGITLKDADKVVAGLPVHGSRVRRGRDWKWGDQDRGGLGTVIAHDQEGIVRVQWDARNLSNRYRYGAEGAYDLAIVDDSPRVLGNDELGDGHNLKVGVEVRRGPDWSWGNQDGGAGTTGIVYFDDVRDRSVYVRWPDGTRGKYRNGNAQCYDLTLTERSRGRGPYHRPPAALPSAPDTTPPAMRPQPFQQLPAGPAVAADGQGAAIGKVTADDFNGLGVGSHSWQWQDTDGTWHLFPDMHTVTLEKGRLQNNVDLTVDGERFTADLRNMVRTSLLSGKACRIRRIALANADRELAEAMEKSLYLM